jgi:energy-coupling factor transport system permease protein
MTSVILYRPSASGLQQANPITKLVLAGTLLAAAATIQPLAQLLAVFIVALVPLAAWSRVLGLFLRTCARLIWPFALSLGVIQGFFAPGSTILLSIGPLALKAEGLAAAAVFSSRLLIGLGSATLLMLTTRPDMLMLALVQRGLPRQLSYIVVTALQIIPSFQSKAQGILDAQRSRGLETEGGVGRRLRALVPLIGPLVLGSLMALEERAIALEARAFMRRGPKTSLQTIADTRAQALVRWALVLLTIGMIAARLFWR